MATGVELCNEALLKLGAKFITNFTDSPTGQICGMLLQSCVDLLSSGGVWTWAEKRATLTPAQTEVEPGVFEDTFGDVYQYVFTLPNDYISMRKVMYNTTEVVDYYFPEITEIEADPPEIEIIYNKRINVAADVNVPLPVYIQDGFTSYLAHRLSPAVDDGARSAEMLQDYAMKIMAAYKMDLRMRPTSINKRNYHSGV